MEKVERKGEGDLGKGKVEVGDGAVQICKEEKLERREEGKPSPVRRRAGSARSDEALAVGRTEAPLPVG